ncbi:hypothetical protein FHW58_001523 [Duganella sp. 1224]|uniref:8-amino-7-oxononanoate synthase n=1 Tax=Duganella sp. 1224 TaxID=2587052 RepID=UPI0015CD69D4|nr:8-amino-7-oxononanoate synthase [Duganella sp. 1224]NYE60371.1 hypothetical protein [Duganella sp. 1224]
MDNLKQAAAGTGSLAVTVSAGPGLPVVDASILLYPNPTGGLPDAAPWESDGMYKAAPAAWANFIGSRTAVEALTGGDGRAVFDKIGEGPYIVMYNHVTPFDSGNVYYYALEITPGGALARVFALTPHISLDTVVYNNGAARSTPHGVVGDTLTVSALYNVNNQQYPLQAGTAADPDRPLRPRRSASNEFRMRIERTGKQSVGANIRMAQLGRQGGVGDRQRFAHYHLTGSFVADEMTPLPVSGKITTTASRTETESTPDLSLWTLIRNSTEALSFNNYAAFLGQLFCAPGAGAVPDYEQQRFPAFEHTFKRLEKRRALPFTDAESYRVLKAATEAFVMVNCGVLTKPLAFGDDDAGYLDRRDLPNEQSMEKLLRRYLTAVEPHLKTLPYLALIRSKLPDVEIQLPAHQPDEANLCVGLIRQRLAHPCLMELIWSYWHEEGMLVQSTNAITRRFQNLRSSAHATGIDPLANTEIDALRPANALLWGYVQDEQHRLSVVRRNYEYDHQYGLHLDGRAVRDFRPADSRSKFIEAFHNLLRQLTPFFRQDDDTTVKADAFPVLNALKEVHLILSQGAHNQYGDLPATARIEMMMQQWLLARPEFREFLPTRVMVAYPEPWMDRVDAMKKLQGWTDTSVAHFRDLAMFGEQLLLSIRYGHWSDVYEPVQAHNWARFWRPQAQGYIHAYRAVTGVDLSAELANPQLESTLPSVLLRQRLEAQQRRA